VPGIERIITPIENTWDSFFLSPNSQITTNFMNERAEQIETDRASLDEKIFT
jgi:antitoxin VapB